MKSKFTIGAKRNDYLKLGILILIIAIYCAVQIPLMATLGIALATIPIIGVLLFAVVCKIPDILIIFLSYKFIDHRTLWYISIPIQLILYLIIVFWKNGASTKWYVLLFMVLSILAEQFVGVLLKRLIKK